MKRHLVAFSVVGVFALAVSVAAQNPPASSQPQPQLKTAIAQDAAATVTVEGCLASGASNVPASFVLTNAKVIKGAAPAAAAAQAKPADAAAKPDDPAAGGAAKPAEAAAAKPAEAAAAQPKPADPTAAAAQPRPGDSAAAKPTDIANAPKAEATGTSGSASASYDVSGISEDQLKSFAGKRVQIEGTLDNAAAKPGQAAQLRGSAIRAASGDCPQK